MGILALIFLIPGIIIVVYLLACWISETAVKRNKVSSKKPNKTIADYEFWLDKSENGWSEAEKNAAKDMCQYLKQLLPHNEYMFTVRATSNKGFDVFVDCVKVSAISVDDGYEKAKQFILERFEEDYFKDMHVQYVSRSRSLYHGSNSEVPMYIGVDTTKTIW